MGFVTVTNARVSPDLQVARIYVSVLGEESDQRRTMAALEHAKGYIQREIAQRVGLRRAPRIALHVDDSSKKIAHISDLIKQIEDAEGPGEETAEGEDAADTDQPSREEL